MKIDILIPHFKTGKLTAYAVSQLIKNKGNHEIKIIISDNNPGDESVRFLEPFSPYITIVPHPKEIPHSHGTSLDRLMKYVSGEYYMTMETDSFPTNPNWLNYYENIIAAGYDGGGSLLSLSGGKYMHPCGAMYKKSIWEECLKYCQSMPYRYIPHISVKESFPCHLMVHESMWESFISNPESYIDVEEKRKGITGEELTKIASEYQYVITPMHNGMGSNEESFSTYGLRNPETGIVDQSEMPSANFINRLGYEPGQFFYYWQLSRGKKLHHIPTNVIWMNNRVGQQQERTVMANGFTHLWGCTSYYQADIPDLKDIVVYKNNMIDALYDTLPENEKVR